MPLTARGYRFGIQLLLLFALLLAAAAPALAVNCSDPPYFGVIDGNLVSPPSQIQIDTSCTIRNFQSPNVLNTNFSFYTQPGGNPERWLVVFDNVVHTGNMSCNNVAGHRIWFTNGSSTKIQEGCQNLLIPVEKIDKRNPAEQTTATVGVPFTYTLTSPVLYDPATGSVINSSGSLNTLHGITLRDDLNATGADLTYLSHAAYWKGSGTPVPHTFSNTGGLLTFAFPDDFVIPAGGQIIVEITVVLEDTPRNAAGTQFSNTAKWEFGRLIDGVFYEPLPGEWGQTLPMTIVAPDLVVTKTGPSSVLNLGAWAEFTMDVLNRGSWAGDAWNIRIVDRLPSAPSNGFAGGMCDLTPEVTGVTLAGTPLIRDTDYALSFAGCELRLDLLEGAGPLGPNQHLTISYRTKVDADTESGAVLTNLAAAGQWSNARDITTGQTYTCPVTDGTEGIADCQDVHDLLMVLSGYFFEKTVANPGTGQLVTSAMPGDTLRYTLRLRSIDEPFTGVRFYDDLNASGAFVPGSLSLVSTPAGADISRTGAGILDVRNLNIPAGGVIEVTFDITLASILPEGFVALNQADLIQGTDKIADSDDPNVDGQADPAVAGDEDPTRVVIYYPPALPPRKETLRTTATVGEEVTYRITVPGEVSTRPLYDVVVTDPLDPNLEYLGATVAGNVVGVSNTSTPTQMNIAITEIPAGEQAVIELRARVRNVPGAQQGVAIDNASSYTYANVAAGATQPALASEAVTLTIIEPHIEEIGKSPNKSAPTAGEIVRYSVTLTASGGTYATDVFDVTVTDRLGLGLAYAGNPAVTVGSGAGAGNTVGAPVITGDGSGTPQVLVWGLDLGNADIDIAEGTTVTLSYDVRVLDSVLANQTLTNSVVAQWTGIDGPSAYERNGTGGLGDLNDYVTAAAEATVTTPDLQATIAKNRSGDTYGAADPDVRIGDIVEYELRLTVPEGTLGSLELVDTLPQGLKFEGIVSINGNTGPTYAAVAPFTHVDITAAKVTTAGDPAAGPSTVTWSLGSVTNQPNDGAGDDFVIVYRARVLNTVFAHTDLRIALDNAVAMTYGTATGNVTSSNNDTITVLQPTLAVSKSSNPVSGSAIAAGNAATYTVEIRNTGTAPAYDVVLRDIIPLGMRAGGVTMVSTSLLSSPAPGLANLAPGYDPATGVATWDFDAGVYAIPAGDTLRVVYRVAVDADPGAGLTLTNQATVDRYYSFDDEAPPVLGGITGEREIYGPTNTASATLYTGAVPTKVLLSPATPEATIGQEVIYRIILPGTVSTNALYDIVVTDPLDPNLEYVGATVTGSAIGVTDSSTATRMEIAIAEIPAGQQAAIDLRARVRNVPEAQQGVAVENTVSYTYANAQGGPSQPALTSGTVTFQLVEPNIAPITKSANRTTATVGETVRYSVTLTAGGGTDFADVFDVAITDRLDLGLAYAGNPSVTVGNGVGADNSIGAPVVTGDGINEAQTLLWSLEDGNADIDLAEGTSVTIAYDVRVLGNVAASQQLTNSVVARWTGIDGPSAFERNGSHGAGGLNDYVTAAASAAVSTPPPGVLSKATTQSTVAIGERLTYTITVPATPVPTALHDVQILDTLTATGIDLRFAGAEVIAGSGWTGPLVNSGSDTDLVIENPDGGIDLPAGGQIRVAITVEVLNTERNRARVEPFVNRAWYRYGNGTTRFGDDPTTGGEANPVTIVHPYLTVTKDGPAAVRVGAAEDFIVEVANGSPAAAWNVTVTDRLPDPVPGGLCDTAPALASAVMVKADGTTLALAPADYAVAFAAAPACGFTVTMVSPATVLAPSDRLRLTYRVTVDEDNIDGTTLTNVAGATEWFSADPSAGERHAYSAPLTDGTPGIADHQDDHTALVQGAILVARKTVENVTTGQAGANATPGDRLRYRITIENTTDVPLSNFSLVDALERLNAEPVFEPASLGNVSVPAAAAYAIDGSTLTVANLNIGANESLTVSFEVVLAPVITSGTVVLNQGELVLRGIVFGMTDDPAAPGDQDPTRTVITSAPLFEVWKTSAILTGDPAVLMAGETLRYTLSVRNVGTEDAVEVRLRDYIPANTTYIANSTTLNGVTVPDASAGISPLATGMLINAPENTTPGTLRADATQGAASVATVTFDVVVDPAVMNGLVIENQGFVAGDGAGSGPQPQQPSDDPATPVLLDPTRNVVGNLPLLGAHKTVQIQQDFGSPGLADPGDVLRYTIRVGNTGPIPATGVVLTDAVPANTTYIADSLRLNGTAVGSDGGVSPLIAGLLLQSSDLPGAGIVSAGGSAVVTFEVRINDGVPAGTVISNQGSVTSAELPAELTDADGLPSNGRQPTVIVVGDAQLLSLTKEVLVVGGGFAQAGGELEYVIRVSNVGSIPATRVVVTDDLGPLGSQVSYVAGSGTLNGAAAGVAFAGSLLTADFASVYGDLPPAAGAVVRFRVRIDAALPSGTTLANTAVVRWNDPAQNASATVELDLGGTPGSAALGGSVWHDANLDQLHDGSERHLEGWSVELYRQNQLLTTVTSGADGSWRLGGLVANEGGEPYEVRFRAPGAGPNTATLGHAASPFTNGPQRISGITVAPGGNLQGLNLPISPNGAVYNSVVRTPIAGARLALLNSATDEPLPERCFDDPAQQNQVTARDGHYKFDLNFSDPSCQPGGTYFIAVTPPAAGYMARPSQIIPPNGEPAAPFSVPACLGSADDAVPASAWHCEVVPSAAVPPLSMAPRTAGTTYHLHLLLSDGRIPGESQAFNNHLPVDPLMDGAVAITKTSSLLNVTKGQLVPYTITVNNVFGVPLFDIAVVDRFPAGFKYVEGSARLDGNAREPRLNGRELVWDALAMEVNGKHTIQLLLVVGAGVGEGEYVNRAQVVNSASGAAVSGEATATVRVIPDPTFDCTDVIGKVFDDRNLNGVQDAAEAGMAGARVVTARGLIATTDEHGRFHLTCAVVPDEDRGSNFILKLDDRTLPTGYRLTTENPRVQRATRGKMLRFNFGATIHRVVAIDLADGAFEPETTRLRLQWEPRIGQLLEELKKGPAVLRLSYLADVEREGVVRDRLKAMKKEIQREWKRAGGGYRLTIETEVFWRRGGPPQR